MPYFIPPTLIKSYEGNLLIPGNLHENIYATTTAYAAADTNNIQTMRKKAGSPYAAICKPFAASASGNLNKPYYSVIEWIEYRRTSSTIAGKKLPVSILKSNT